MDTLTPSQQLAAIKTITKLREKAIAERIGCSQPTVNRILNGRCDCRGTTLLEIQRWHNELTAAGADAQPA
jgi:transcriptional regulator with XRE-family HTH domain